MVELANERNPQLFHTNKEMSPQKLKDLARENMNKLKESEVRLADQVCSLHKTIAELEKKCGQHPSTLLEVRF